MASQISAQSRPRFFRFSIRHLLIWTAAIALACVALRSSSDAWSGFVHAIALASLGTAILLVTYRNGADRAFWFGFAVSGWLYVAILMYGWLLPKESSYLVPIEPKQLFTSQISAVAYEWSYPFLAPRTARYGGIPTSTGFIGPIKHEFLNTAHAFWTLLLAACGGSIAQWLYLTRDREPAVDN